MADPNDGVRGLLGLFGDWREIAIVWGLATLGGLARLAKALADGKGEKIEYAKIAAKLFIAGFSGLCFYWLTGDWTIGPHWKALCIALSGHMGGESIEFVEGIVKDTIRRYAGSTSPPKDP